MPTPSLLIPSPPLYGRVLGFSVEIAGGIFYLEPTNLSVINLANDLDGFQLYKDSCLRPVEAHYGLKATSNTDNATNQIMVAPQEHEYENHTFNSALNCYTNSHEVGDAHLYVETKKVEDDYSLSFTRNSLYDLRDSSPDDTLRYFLPSGVVDVPPPPLKPNVFNTSSHIQEGEASIQLGNSHASPTSQTCSTPRARTTLCRHHCPWAGCASKFRRAADRDRHFLTTHGRPVKHFCNVAGCSRGRGLWRGYSREDKLKEHVKKVHDSGKPLGHSQSIAL